MLDPACPADGRRRQQLSRSVVVEHEQGIEDTEVLDQHRTRPADGVHADLDTSLGRAVDDVSARG